MAINPAQLQNVTARMSMTRTRGAQDKSPVYTGVHDLSRGHINLAVNHDHGCFFTRSSQLSSQTGSRPVRARRPLHVCPPFRLVHALVVGYNDPLTISLWHWLRISNTCTHATNRGHQYPEELPGRDQLDSEE
jgi:hypothetical protein